MVSADIIPQPPQMTFPPRVADFVQSEYEKAGVILEYGSGGSTVAAAQMDGKKIFTVESDPRWLCNLNTYLQFADIKSMPHTIHADIGQTKAWGFPVDASKKNNFPNYALGVWDVLHQIAMAPDLILIDGRFRAACFLAAAMNCRQATTVLFDDYVGRNYKSVVEQIYEPTRFVERMAVFEITPNDDLSSVLSQHDKVFYNPH